MTNPFMGGLEEGVIDIRTREDLGAVEMRVNADGERVFDLILVPEHAAATALQLYGAVIELLHAEARQACDAEGLIQDDPLGDWAA
jgi:hypothetical protein